MVKKKAHGGVNSADIRALLHLMREKVDASLLEFLLREGTAFRESVGSSERQRAGDENWQNRVIDQEIPRGASILDLGCGEGNLLTRMAAEKQARVQGVELDSDKVEICVEKGVPVIQADLDGGLRVFPDDSFDYVI
ncbi:MAG: methionine biosynthesis protein MetW, partial [Planctomycetes bacterium]|nr:methionine biosynthesis protein MetW [Planctomycetota bacterium]